MFSSKSKTKVNLDRVKTRTTAPMPAPIVRPTVDQRRALRKGTWCVCQIMTREGAVREGVILDVSETGARVRFRDRGELPRIVKIKASRIGLHRFARVVWQRIPDAGLEFISTVRTEPR